LLASPYSDDRRQVIGYCISPTATGGVSEGRVVASDELLSHAALAREGISAVLAAGTVVTCRRKSLQVQTESRNS